MTSVPGRVEAWDVVLADFLLRLLRLGFRRFDEIDALVERLRDDVPVVQERVFLEADVDERGFQAGFEVFDLALEDAGDDLFLARALDGEFFEHAAFHDGDAILESLGVDDDLLVELLLRRARSSSPLRMICLTISITLIDPSVNPHILQQPERRHRGQDERAPVAQ